MLLWGRSGTVGLEDGRRYVVNPGSVGQPRERRPLVRFAVLDREDGKVEFRATRYDDHATRRSLAEHGLPRDACHRRPSLRTRTWQVKAALRRAAARLGGN